jgi:acyl-CoA thioesterase FadM
MQTEEFFKLYEATWEQMDPLGHLRGPVLLDYVLNTQMSWITHYGYGQEELAAAGYDPVVLKLEARYHHEVRLGETVRDTCQLVCRLTGPCGRPTIKLSTLTEKRSQP